MDTHTLKTLFRRASSRPPHIFCPLGNRPYLESIGVPQSSIHILDWWDSKRLTIESGSESESALSVDLTCTPCQHFTGRGLNDRRLTLWASWAVEESTVGKSEKGLKLFFGGDTGYRSVKDGENEDEVPSCPVFKEIGEVFGGFDVALIPIGLVVLLSSSFSWLLTTSFKCIQTALVHVANPLCSPRQRAALQGYQSEEGSRYALGNLDSDK